jgi:hypothetical protein
LLACEERRVSCEWRFLLLLVFFAGVAKRRGAKESIFPQWWVAQEAFV